MGYGKFKDLNKRAFAGKVLRDSTCNIDKHPKFNEYQRGIASVAYKFLIKKTSASNITNEITSNKELANEQHKPADRKPNKRKMHLPFIDNSCGADLADMQLISKFNKEFRFLLCAIDIYSKYIWVIPINNKKGITIIDASQKDLEESNHKPNKIWLDKGSEFYKRSMKSWFKKNDI